MSDSPTLTLRGQHSDDLEPLYALLNTPDILLNSFDLPYLSEEAFRERYGNPPAGTHVLIAETGQPSGRRRLIGAAWLRLMPNRRRHVAQLRLAVHPDYRETESEAGLLRAALDLADQWIGLRRVEAAVYAGQAQELALYERFGFEREALMRGYAFRAGVCQDVVLLARLNLGK